MVWAQMYDVKVDGILGRAQGDKAMLILSGMQSKTMWHIMARSHTKKHKYCAYSLHKGRMGDSAQLSGIKLVR